MQSILGLGSAASDKIDFNPDRDHAHNFTVHATAKDPYELYRVLNFDDGDFRRADNELQRAQAYSLFAYCMHAGRSRTSTARWNSRTKRPRRPLGKPGWNG